MSLCDLSAFELSQLLRQKRTSAVEIVESCLERIHAVDGRPGSLDSGEITAEDAGKVHAFITLTGERALAQAREIDRKLAGGEKTPAPWRACRSRSRIFSASTARPPRPPRASWPISPPPTPPLRSSGWKQAGAVVLGKVNLDEFTYGSSNESSAFQPSPRNPWNPARVPGGSSGGSAASVAAGEAALSLGTDTAGSIRQPAAFCGVVGVKPTYGRVSRYGLIAFGSSLDCPGPVARDVTDAAMMLQAIAGPDPRDATAANVPVPDYLAKLEGGVKGMRIGLSPDYFRISFPDPDTGEYTERGHAGRDRVPGAARRPRCWPTWGPKSSRTCPCPTRATACRSTS